jgi:aminoglycoside 2'-N-acetyltransferase I
MTEVRLVHTAELNPGMRAAARALLFEVFPDLTEDDWEHCLGGLHALVYEGSELVGHASVIQRRLLYRGRALRTGYIEGVAVRANRRRRGYGAAMMAALERVVRGAYELGALGAAEQAIEFYLARGWQPWQGPTSVLAPGGLRRTEEDDGAVYVLPVSTTLDLSDELTCDWRGGDVW